LYYYRGRYYSPSLKRFVSEDPMGLVAGLNEYAYVGGDPISMIDPSGLMMSPIRECGGRDWTSCASPPPPPDPCACKRMPKFNPTKAVTAIGNGLNAGRLFATGYGKIAGGFATAGTGVGAAPGAALAAWGAWNVNSGNSAWARAAQGWDEAMNETWCDATPKNFWGIGPHGTSYDDPGEPAGPLSWAEGTSWGLWILGNF